MRQIQPRWTVSPITELMQSITIVWFNQIILANKSHPIIPHLLYERTNVESGQRGLLGGFDDHRVSTGQSRRYLPYKHQQRKIPLSTHTTIEWIQQNSFQSWDLLNAVMVIRYASGVFFFLSDSCVVNASVAFCNDELQLHDIISCAHKHAKATSWDKKALFHQWTHIWNFLKQYCVSLTTVMWFGVAAESTTSICCDIHFFVS